MNVAKIAYKPVGLVLGAAGGALAGMLFKRLWKATGHQEDVPEATDEGRGWREVLVAAALQGAVFSTVKAVVDRSGAVATRRLTGTWPA